MMMTTLPRYFLSCRSIWWTRAEPVLESLSADPWIDEEEDEEVEDERAKD